MSDFFNKNSSELTAHLFRNTARWIVFIAVFGGLSMLFMVVDPIMAYGSDLFVVAIVLLLLGAIFLCFLLFQSGYAFLKYTKNKDPKAFYKGIAYQSRYWMIATITLLCFLGICLLMFCVTAIF